MIDRGSLQVNTQEAKAVREWITMKMDPHPLLPALIWPAEHDRAESVGARRLLAATLRLHSLEDTWSHHGHTSAAGPSGCYACTHKALIVLEAAAGA